MGRKEGPGGGQDNKDNDIRGNRGAKLPNRHWSATGPPDTRLLFRSFPSLQWYSNPLPLTPFPTPFPTPTPHPHTSTHIHTVA